MYSKKNIKNFITLIIAVLSLLSFSSVNAAEEKNSFNYSNSKYRQSTLYYNGNIITADDKNPFAEAVLTGDGKIVQAGSMQKVLSHADYNTKFVNLHNKTMLPGFVDAHSHINAVGQYDDYSPAAGITSIKALVSLGKTNFNNWYNKCKNDGTYENGDWYVGNGYDNSLFSDELPPTADDLDQISTEVPICIIHISSHMAVINHKALTILNYIKGSPMLDTFKGLIKLDAEGNPTGLIQEYAYFRLYQNPNILYDNTKTNTKNGINRLKDACNTYASYGITTAQDAAPSTLPAAISAMNAHGERPLLDIIHYDTKENVTTAAKESKFVNGYKTGGVKIILDGSPQGKTAWLQQPYYVIPDGKSADYCGAPSMSDDEVYNTMVECLRNGWQLLAHANGSAAIEQFINQYEKAKKDTGITTDIRPVIIHAQTITEDQLNKCSWLGINLSFFCDHVYYWGDYYLSSILGPEKGNRISPIASALNRHMNITMHQDSPVVPPNMMFSIHNAVNRVTRNGIVLGAENKISVMNAIKLVTINSAYQSFEEETRGSITNGKLADFVILDQNPLTVNPSTIKDIKVLKTIKEDKVIYTNEN